MPALTECLVEALPTRRHSRLRQVLVRVKNYQSLRFTVFSAWQAVAIPPAVWPLLSMLGLHWSIRHGQRMLFQSKKLKSVGAIGTAVAQQHLRNILAYLDVPTLGQPEAFVQGKDGLFDSAGNIGPDSKAVLQSWKDQYVAWVKKHN